MCLWALAAGWLTQKKAAGDNFHLTSGPSVSEAPRASPTLGLCALEPKTHLQPREARPHMAPYAQTAMGMREPVATRDEALEFGLKREREKQLNQHLSSYMAPTFGLDGREG